jgi:hypothetical protein
VAKKAETRRVIERAIKTAETKNLSITDREKIIEMDRQDQWLEKKCSRRTFGSGR